MAYQFTLAGESYELTREAVEERMKHLVPKPVERYAVTINGRRFPPKQVVATALDLPLVRFTTMDAARILSGLGLTIEDGGSNGAASKTESETLFEGYLSSRHIGPVEYERQFEGTTRRPDYALSWGDQLVLFELKEFHATPEDFRSGFGAYDPYGPIREKLDAGREKFKGLKDHPCAVVLYNREKPLVHLGWQYVYGAMLGNLVFSIPIDRSHAGVQLDDSQISTQFGPGGKMHRERGGVPVAAQNTTLSAVLVLQHLAVGRRRFGGHVREIEAQQGRKLALEEHLRLMEQASGTERDVSLMQLRVVVHENPYARVPLPDDIFTGPYDERYGASDGRIQRLFAGEEVAKLPDED
jgi:hypothetical protein